MPCGALADRLEGINAAIPAGDNGAALRPRKYPGDRPQAGEATGASPGWTGTDRQTAELVNRRGLLPVVEKARSVIHQLPICRVPAGSNALHSGPPGGFE